MGAFNFNEPNIELYFNEDEICSNPAFQTYLVRVHSISPENFALAVTRFSYPIPNPRTYSSKDIYAALTVSCDGHIVNLDYKEKDNTSNQDIEYSVDPAATTNYSVAYFLGLEKIFPNAEFEFFKAITKPVSGKTDADDVIFRIITTDATGIKHVVYYGDLSDIEP